jgi:hypothetical protein
MARREHEINFFGMRHEIVLHNLNEFLKHVWKRNSTHVLKNLNFFI